MKDLLAKHDHLVKLELQEAMKFTHQVSSTVISLDNLSGFTGTSHFLRGIIY